MTTEPFFNNLVSIGVDIGGTKIACGVLRGETVQDASTIATPDTGWEAVLDAVAAQVRELLAKHPEVQRIGVGAPGPLSADRQRVRFAPNIYGFNDVPVVAGLRERLGFEAGAGQQAAGQQAAGLHVVLENDARAAALAEAHLGAARGTHSSMYITVSTGIGGGVVIGGRLWHGHNGMAGEVGHIMALPGGPISGAGLDGSLEAVASGTAIARDTSYALNRRVSTPEAFALAQAGDAVAGQIVGLALRRIGIALTDLQKIIDPEVFVIGGGVAAVGDYFFAGIEAAAQEYGAPFAVPNIRRAQLGANVGVIGAALAAG